MCESWLDAKDPENPNFKSRATTQQASFPLPVHEAEASDHQCTVRNRRVAPCAFSRSGKDALAHHRGLVGLRISDGKFVNHTTEMIL